MRSLASLWILCGCIGLASCRNTPSRDAEARQPPADGSCIPPTPPQPTCDEVASEYTRLVAELGKCSRSAQCRPYGTAYLTPKGPLTPGELGFIIFLNRDKDWSRLHVTEQRLQKICHFISMDFEYDGAFAKCIDGHCRPRRRSAL